MITCLCQFVAYVVILYCASVSFILPRGARNLQEQVGSPLALQTPGYGVWSLPPKGNECYLRTPNATTTGAKVFVPAPPKTGSTSMQMALQMLGLRAYKMEDYVFFMGPLFHALARGEAHTPEGVKLPSLAAALHGCRVDAFFTDGMDLLIPFAEMYKASPGVKVIITERPFQATHKSLLRFFRYLEGLNILGNTVFGSFRVLPWHPLLWRLGFIPEDTLVEGGPELFRANAFWEQYWFFTHTVPAMWELIRSHTWPWLVEVMDKEETVDAHWKAIVEMVPPEDLLFFDVKKHGWKELVSFLGMEEPAGSFPNARNLEVTGNDAVSVKNPAASTLVRLGCVLCHIVNFLLVRVSWSFIAGLGRSRAIMKTKDQ